MAEVIRVMRVHALAMALVRNCYLFTSLLNRDSDPGLFCRTRVSWLSNIKPSYCYSRDNCRGHTETSVAKCTECGVR